MKSSSGSEVALHGCLSTAPTTHLFLIVPTDSPNKQWNLTPATVEHIGEEVSDVLVYSTRLADLCGLDLASAVVGRRPPQESSDCSSAVGACTPWRELALDDISSAHYRAGPCGEIPVVRIRSTLFLLQSSLGAMCAVFSKDGYDNVINMTVQDKAEIARHLSGIVIALGDVCVDVGISLSSSVTDKIAKNIKKYPKDIVKGSSAKYTEYKIHTPSGATRQNSALIQLAVCISSFAMAGFLIKHS